MEITITGKIVYVGDLQTGTTSQGSPFSRRELQVETIEEYPSSILFELTNEKAVNCNVLIGQSVRAHLKPRVYQTANGRRFNSIRCWSLEVLN